MTKDIFTVLSKSYIRKFKRKEISAEELIAWLRLIAKNLENPPMFRFGKDCTIIYSIDEMEKDLLHSTNENKELLIGLIQYACKKKEIIILF